MKNIIRSMIGLGLSVVLLSGCASRKEIVQFKDDVAYLRQQVDAIRQENAELKKQVGDINQSLASLQNETNRAKADLLSEMSSIRDKTLNLDNKLEDTSYRMDKLLLKAEDQAKPPATIPDSVTTSMPAADAQQDSSVAVDGMKPKALYDAAYLDLSKGNYELALQGFREFLKTFPKSDFADNAQYWIGEIFYARSDYQQAFDAFKKVVANYPGADKVLAALLKMGFSMAEMNDTAGATKYLKAVINNFPNSDEARLAQARLEEMGATPTPGGNK